MGNGQAKQVDVVVLGAGAAGMMCAFEAGRRGRRVVLIDHAEAVGKKILISGGGRCNFTNTGTTAENYLSANPHFAKSALARFRPADMIALVEKHGIKFHEKTLGQLFCDTSSREIVTMLERECTAAKVETLTGTKVADVARRENQSGFRLETSRGVFEAKSVVVATGGLSIPKMGATGFGYEIARQFGIAVMSCKPGLVPLTMRPEELAQWSDLSGLSCEVIAKTGQKKKNRPFREKMLVTHRGLSGPAILQVSSYWGAGEAVEFDLAPGMNVTAGLLEAKARRDEAALMAALKKVLPGRMAERWVALNLPDGWSNAAIAKLEERVHAWPVIPAGTEGFEKAEVTVGGVDTNELDARTMESRKMPGLYFIGEVVDVTGWLGGYNFQWAWASAVSAGSVA